MHVDDFIDNPIPLQKFSSDAEREGVRYAKFVLLLMRTSASFQLDIRKFIPPLYCTVDGVRLRCVFASRMGWVGFTRDFEKETYDHGLQCEPDIGCSNWGAEP